MTWHWRVIGPNGRILHLVEPHKAARATEVKFHALCGEKAGSPVPTLVEENGDSKCLFCYRRALAQPGDV
jgi:hypothetical protein